MNYKYRMHDSRVGRFFAVDPLSPEYPWNSPYAFSENRVVDGIELEGLEHYYTADGKYLGYIGTPFKDNNYTKSRTLNSKADEIHVRNAIYKQQKGTVNKYSKWYSYDVKMAYENSTPKTIGSIGKNNSSSCISESESIFLVEKPINPESQFKNVTTSPESNNGPSMAGASLVAAGSSESGPGVLIALAIYGTYELLTIKPVQTFSIEILEVNPTKVKDLEPGTVVPTPDTDKGNFKKGELKGEKVNKETGEIWSKSKTSHRGEKWKVWPEGTKGRGKTPDRRNVGEDGTIKPGN